MKINEEFFRHIRDSFGKYVEFKRIIDDKIIENNNWFTSQLEFSNQQDSVNPTTAFVFNAIANKHAEAMDSYPESNILPRHKLDEGEAQALSKIVPIQLEMSDFRNVYSKNWWSKLKNGMGIYGVFFKNDANNGIGDISIKKLDILNVFWEPYITDIQDSEYLFLTSFIKTDTLKDMYNDKTIIPYQDEACVRRYHQRWEEDLYSEKSLVVDCYYKHENTVHLIKFCGDTILDSTEERGMDTLYQHGLYPIVVDALFPLEDSIMGVSMIELMKNPQEYINKLDSIISKNALISGKIRFMVKDNGGINEHELSDMSSDIIHVAGSVDDSNVRQFQASPLDAFIINHRLNKISEMKEIAGNRDFQQGGTSNGVTAYSAISALQQSGEKLSRDMICQSYEAFKQIIFMCIELIRQFYFEPRFYRVQDENGLNQYISYSNKNLLNQSTYIDGFYRSPEFDVDVSVQKNNPYSKAMQNQIASDLYKMGVFDVQNVDKAIMLVELMQFEGKEKVMQYLRKTAEGVKEEKGNVI